MIVTSILSSVANTALQASPAILPQVAATVTEASASSLLPQAVAALMVAGGQQQLPELARLRLRLDGFHTYSVITSLLMNAGLRLFSSTPKNFKKNDRTQNIIKVLFSFSVAVSIIAGSYTTIVFSLLGLYIKRALGRGYDDKVVQYFTETKGIRELAYDTCLICLIAFQASFVFSLYLNHDEGMNWKIGIFAGVAAAIACWKWSTLMILARTVLDLGVE